MQKFLPSLVLFVILSITLTAQPGALDTRFGKGGFVVTDAGTMNNSSGYDIVMLPNGKTVVSGKTEMSSSLVDAVLLRYNINGSLDSSFGTNGTVLESFTNTFDNFSSVALQPDGKLVVCGLSIRNDSFLVLFARYNANGKPDTSFRTKRTAVKYYGFGAVATDVIVQPDKKILLLVNNNQDITFKAQTQVERYNEDGTLDSTFGKKGNVTYTGDFWFTKFTIDNAGRIICMSGDAGFTSLLRLKSNGAPDKSFGVNGIITTRVSPYDGSADLVAQADGKIVIGGFLQASNFVDNLFSVYRFNTNGTLDSSFNGTGINSTKITGIDYTYDVALQQDGKIVATGFSIASNTTYITLMRYNKNGKTDLTWGKNGIDTVATVWKKGRYSYAVASAVATDGSRIAVTGNQVAKNYAKNAFLTARFLLQSNNIAEAAVSADAVVSQNNHTVVYPNPVHNTTTVSFDLPKEDKINVLLLNAKGETVSVIFNGTLSSGKHNLPVDLSIVASGTYYVIVETKIGTQHFKLIKL